ncbi:tlg2p-like protein a [Lycium barbarum]|uniref:tlg2p-like protein a n=1 Tax=Lycium barbarum TaxID=112863 RepID=UPI00293F438B|nr:tlg2p-like protein a [Lycium barbarum]
MATRNRSRVFQRYRDTLNENRIPFTTSSNGAVIEMATTSFLNSKNTSYTPLSTQEDLGPSTSRDAFTVGLPPAWVDVSEEVAASINQAQVKLAELKKCHAKALTPSFGDGREDQRVIEVLTVEITDILRKSEKRLQKLSASGSSEDSNVRKNVQHSLATDLQNLSVELRRMQSLYLKQLRQQSEGHDGLDLEMNEKKSSFLDDDFNDVGFTELQMATGQKDEQLTAEREREIRQVLKSVNELAQIMKDLSVLVIDQGTIVDRIDHNVQSVSASVEEGFKQLQKAERSQRKGGMVKCATVLVITCFIMLVLLVLKEILL